MKHQNDSSRNSSVQSVGVEHAGLSNSSALHALFLAFLCFFGWPVATVAAADTIHHDYDIILNPSTSEITVVGSMTVPASVLKQSREFELNTDLDLELPFADSRIELVAENQSGSDVGIDRDDANGGPTALVDRYRITGDDNEDVTIKFRYGGKINYPVENVANEYARSFSQSPGLINEQGVYLAGSTVWIPTIADTYITYEIDISLPDGWRSVSQGERTLHQSNSNGTQDRWVVSNPTEEIYLIGAKFVEYEQQHGGVKSMAFLRQKDDALAEKYLDTTGQYLAMYQDMLGPYPYSKFALVENFWETGYGMPSFTLLGPQIIRFPFILHSSYPHELLHNWWGNGVFVDFDSGNWCEGLTSYMADHLVAEQRGQGGEYRRSTLQRYTDYAKADNDFPLSKFKSRYDGVTEAVGYGKSLMTWNMLRNKVGDEHFVRSFQDFYRSNMFRRASYDDIRKSFEKVSDQDLKGFFKQWVERTGAPEFRLEEASTKADGKKTRLTLSIRQIQPGDSYDVDLPIAVYTADAVERHVVRANRKQQKIELSVEGEPVEVVLDPEFDIFRRLHFAEIPPSLSKMFGADKIQIVVPSAGETARYQQLANLWKGENDNISVVRDNDLDGLAKDSAVWILGDGNKFAGLVKSSLDKYDVSIAKDEAVIGKDAVDLTSNSAIFVTRHPDDPNLAVALVTAHSSAAVPGLAAKLPHYGKYSYLTFTGDEPANILKGQWQAVDSPMRKQLADASSSADIEPRAALGELKPIFDADRMMSHIKKLAAPAMEGRGVGTKGLKKAADYIADEFKRIGLQPGGDNGTWFQDFETLDGPDGKPVTVRNVVAILTGINPSMKGQSAILSAHFDHLGFGWPNARADDAGKMHPGADDNASGVAVMLELADGLAKTEVQRSIVFVATSAEESGLLGARHFAAQGAAGHPIDKAFATVNLDTIGRLEDGKVMIFGGSSASEWRFIFMGATAVTGIETEMVAQEINASDHTAFQEAGVPAVHIFASVAEDYHRPTDTAEKIDEAGLVKVAAIAKEAIVYMSERPEPLTKPSSLGTTSTPPSATSTGRKVSTGSIPDFAFSGKGVRFSGVTEGSPADIAGMKEGDVLTSLDGKPVGNLRDYTNLLAALEPGQTVDVVFERDGAERTSKMTLVPR